jgi:predicted outer membrane repeat protein
MFAVDAGAGCNIWQLSILGGTDSGIKNSGGLTLGSCTVSGNTGDRGGGISNNAGSLFLYDTLVTGNVGFVKGGGIYNVAGGTVICWETTFTGNSAGDGGAIYNWDNSVSDTSSVDLEYDTEIIGNSAFNNGGGIYNLDGSLTMGGGDISFNTAGNNGGGVYQDSLLGTSVFTEVLIANNSVTGGANRGGGMCLNGGSAAFFGCTVFSNTATTGAEIAWKSPGSTLYVDETSFIFGSVVGL